MAALSTIHDVTGRRLVSSIYSWYIYGYDHLRVRKYLVPTRLYFDIVPSAANNKYCTQYICNRRDCFRYSSVFIIDFYSIMGKCWAEGSQDWFLCCLMRSCLLLFPFILLNACFKEIPLHLNVNREKILL
jgi:hypothetical protein